MWSKEIVKRREGQWAKEREIREIREI